MSGDNIYNGAVDNGTGCGVLLEMAHAFAMSSAKPPSPVVLAAVTAEEKGLLGSNYLGKHLPIPADEFLPGMDFTSDAAVAKAGFALGWQALLAKATVNWQPGDEFEATRLRGITH